MSNTLIQLNNCGILRNHKWLVRGVSLKVDRGQIVTLIGPNGSGKSTLFNVITGNLKPDTGKVFYNGVDISNSEPFELFHLGVLRTFQIAHEFTNMTVIENLMVVPGNQKGESLL